MLTVVAIEESLMRDIGDFEPLLTSVANDGEYKICSWKRTGNTLPEAIPALFDREFITDGELLMWNILVVSDDRNRFVSNPFGGCYSDDYKTNDVFDKELNELAKMLGVVPVHSEVSSVKPENKKQTTHFDVKINDELQIKKLNEYKIDDFTRPNKIYLMAVQKNFDVDIHESNKNSFLKPNVYETFSEKGAYPPNCRFFKFNISSKSNKITMHDYLRLWMTVLSFAYNDGSDDIYIAPYVLYSIDCDIDKDVLTEQITEIYSRVHFVRKFTESRIERIHRLREIESGKKYDMPALDSSITVDFETDESKLYLDNSKFGLAKNCPVKDEEQYAYQRDIIEKNIKEYLKAPRRAIRRSVFATKKNGIYVSETDQRIQLDIDQMEDLDESIDVLEMEIMKADNIDINYPKENEEERKQADKRTYKTMKRRSTVGAIVGSSLLMFAAFVLAFLPYIVNSIIEVKTSQTISASIILTIACVLIMAVCGFVSLIFFRFPLSNALYHFKKVIDSLVSFVNNQAEAYSNYLSKLSSFMKRNSFKRYLAADASDFLREEEDLYVINRDYCCIVENNCKAWADALKINVIYRDDMTDEAFALDLNPTGNPIFSFVKSNGIYGMEYNHDFSYLETPYEFIKSLNIRREEVYSDD